MSDVARRRLWGFLHALLSNGLTDASPRLEQPEHVRTPLLLHQTAVLHAALELEASKVAGLPCVDASGVHLGRLVTTHGVLCDRAGAGKSLVALALAGLPPPPDAVLDVVARSGDVSTAGNDVVLVRERSAASPLVRPPSAPPLRLVKPALFIVPHNVVAQWQAYVERDTTLTALFVRKRRDADEARLLAALDPSGGVDAVVVSATMWREVAACACVQSALWPRVFLDEADTLGLAARLQDLPARFYWLITASTLNVAFPGGLFADVEFVYRPPPDTPPSTVALVAARSNGGKRLQVEGVAHNNLVRALSGASSHHSHGLSLNAAAQQSGRLFLHAEDAFVDASFTMPPLHHARVACRGSVEARVLDTLVAPEVLERLHAGDVRGALEAVGVAVAPGTSVVAAVTASLERDLAQAQRVWDFKRTLEYSSPSAREKALEAAAARVESLRNRVEAIAARVADASGATCPICVSEVAAPTVTPCCRNLFCFACLCEALRHSPTCPLCRERIASLTELHVVGPQPTVAEQQQQQQQQPRAPPALPSKTEAFLHLVTTSAPTSRVLCFSAYDATFGALERQLDAAGVAHTHLTGTQARVSKVLRDFAGGAYRVLFLNARHVGAGINIEAATHVVLYHRMAGELEAQIVGRAYRLGRAAPLQVVHLLHPNEAAAEAATAVATGAVLSVPTGGS